MLRGHLSIPILARLIYASVFVRFAIAYLCSMKCIAVIMTSFVETFCYEALVVGARLSRLSEAVLTGTHDRWLSRAKNRYYCFFFAVVISQGLEGVRVSYVCCRDT